MAHKRQRDNALYGVGFALEWWGVIYLVGPFYVATTLPYLAVTVRRLHDVNKSGWWFFIQLVPLIGPVWLFCLMVIGGTPGPNRFGE